MAFGRNNEQIARLSGLAQTQESEVDAGLRLYMLRVYNYMASGLILTGIFAYGGTKFPALLIFM